MIILKMSFGHHRRNLVDWLLIFLENFDDELFVLMVLKRLQVPDGVNWIVDKKNTCDEFASDWGL